MLSTDRALDVLIEITPYISEIVSDDDIKQIAVKHRDEKNQVKYFAELLPLFLKKYREAVYTVLAAVNETTVDEIKNQSAIETMKQVKAIAEDKDLVSFFSSFAPQA